LAWRLRTSQHQISFLFCWVHNLSWAFHLLTCCTSQAPHYCNTLLPHLLCKILALIGPLIFKIKMHILRGSITKALNIHCLSLI
jgi:hypothetical protein